MEDLVHDLPLPVDFEQREHVGVAGADPVVELEPIQLSSSSLTVATVSIRSMLAIRAWSPVAEPFSSKSDPVSLDTELAHNTVTKEVGDESQVEEAHTIKRPLNLLIILEIFAEGCV